MYCHLCRAGLLPVTDVILAFGITVTASVAGALVPHVFPAVTVIFPFWPAEPVVTVAIRVPCPPVIVHPAGTVHVYVVAFGTAAIL